HHHHHHHIPQSPFKRYVATTAVLLLLLVVVVVVVIFTSKTVPVSAQYLHTSVQVQLTGTPSVFTSQLPQQGALRKKRGRDETCCIFLRKMSGGRLVRMAGHKTITG
ncbi:unnamed protein product, partial [Ectocarpus sp. 12 AP-2014]